jgi:hypothetical protein
MRDKYFVDTRLFYAESKSSSCGPSLAEALGVQDRATTYSYQLWTTLCRGSLLVANWLELLGTLQGVPLGRIFGHGFTQNSSSPPYKN